MLVFCILALASGASSLRQMAKFMKTRLPVLREAFGCQWRQAPTHTALYTILKGVDAAGLEQALRAHAQGLAVQAGGKVLAMDGKQLRGSLERLADRHAAQVLSVFAVEQALVLGQIVIEDQSKDHEIPAAQRLIQELGLSGRLFTMDALHLQKKRWKPPCTAITT